MAKTSKMTAHRLSVSRTVHSSVATHGGDIAVELTQVLFPDGPPAKWSMDKMLAAVQEVLAAVGKVLERADAAVAATELAHLTELADDDGVRQARDEAAAAVRARLVSQRELLAGAFGAGILKTYGLDEAVPEAMQQLLQRAAATVKLLRTRPLVEKPRHSAVTLDPKRLAADLEAEQAALQAALTDTKREEREAQTTLTDKNRAAEAWQPTYQAVSSALYGLYLLAGRKDLADRITPTARRRAGLPEEGDTPADEEPTPER